MVPMVTNNVLEEDNHKSRGMTPFKLAIDREASKS